MPRQADQIETIVSWLGQVSGDPLAFVLGAYAWGEGELAESSGPRPWQREILVAVRDGLLDLSSAIQLAVSSGHGVGKSALVAWLLDWAQSTMEDTIGVVTANTATQLTTKTWAEFARWHRRSISAPFFEMTATSRHSRDPAHEKTWRIDMVPWNEQRPEAFAGLHNKGKRIVLIFDEASSIADIIWETAEGALTDENTQIIWACFGNPTKNTGRFQSAFRDPLHKVFWRTWKIDSRLVEGTNKELISKWLIREGEDSDFFKVRVRGEFPESSLFQLFSIDAVDSAICREALPPLPREPLILGVDVSRLGDDETVFAYRRGNDAKSIPWERMRKLPTDIVCDRLVASIKRYAPDAVFIDEGNTGGALVDFVRRLGFNVIAVNFTSRRPNMRANDTLVANKRAEMYVLLRDWLPRGILPPEESLREQFIESEYFFNKRDELQISPKEDLLDSPDLVDAIALTFAFPVSKQRGANASLTCDYDPYSLKALREGLETAA